MSRDSRAIVSEDVTIVFDFEIGRRVEEEVERVLLLRIASTIERVASSSAKIFEHVLAVDRSVELYERVSIESVAILMRKGPKWRLTASALPSNLTLMYFGRFSSRKSVS